MIDRDCNVISAVIGDAENAGLENTGPLKMQGWKTQDWKTQDQA